MILRLVRLSCGWVGGYNLDGGHIGHKKRRVTRGEWPAVFIAGDGVLRRGYFSGNRVTGPGQRVG